MLDGVQVLMLGLPCVNNSPGLVNKVNSGTASMNSCSTRGE